MHKAVGFWLGEVVLLKSFLVKELVSVSLSFLGSSRFYAGEVCGMIGSVSFMSLLLLTGIVITLLLVVVLRKRKRKRKAGETDYRAFFIMGVVFLPTGFAMMIVYVLEELPFEIGLPLFALGLIYLIIGLVNRDKWKKAE